MMYADILSLEYSRCTAEVSVSSRILGMLSKGRRNEVTRPDLYSGAVQAFILSIVVESVLMNRLAMRSSLEKLLDLARGRAGAVPVSVYHDEARRQYKLSQKCCSHVQVVATRLLQS